MDDQATPDLEARTTAVVTTTMVMTTTAGRPGVARVAETPALDELATERLEAQICALAARRAVDDAQWLALIAEFDRREAYLTWECRSTAYWLNWHCGLSLGAGREQVRVGRALEGLPLVRQALEAGRLSYSKVRAVTRVATPVFERSWLDLALGTTAAQLERICSAYRRVDRPDEAAEAVAAAERQGVSIWHDDHGLTRLDAAMVPDDGALVEAALAAAAAQLIDAATTSGVSAETPNRASTRADALAEIARSYLATHPAPPPVERRHLLVLVDVGELTVDGRLTVDAGGRCALNGRRLTPENASLLGCNAALTQVLIDHRGLPLSVGRRSRVATPAQRLALEVRDGGQCRYPGCTSRLVDAHHVVPWEHHGRTDLENLVLLCRRHHRRVHLEREVVTLDPDTAAVEVRRRDGTVVAARAVDPADAPVRPPAPTAPLLPGEAGARLDVPFIIDGLVTHDSPRPGERVE